MKTRICLLSLLLISANLAPAFAADAPASDPASPKVELKTSQGKITLELYPDKAPKSVENFLKYVKDGFYDGLIFHRVIDGFMIQGGGFDKKMSQKATRGKIQNEAKNGLKNEKGTLAMARTSDPHSASSQFFINLSDNAFLDYPGQDGWGYAVFGKVVDGLDVVEKIGKVKTGRANGMGDVPVEAVTIEKATLAGAKKKK
jgi:peptidyl-prolyl cis-trans isomerase A (cyclophilin A)